MPILSLQSVCKQFGAVPVLVDCTFVVDGPTIVAVQGHSGSGKTTLLRLVAGLETPDAGSITFGKSSPLSEGGPRGVLGNQGVSAGPIASRGAKHPTLALPSERGGNVGIVFQHPVLMPHLNVRDNLAMGYRLHYNVFSTIWWEKPEPSELRQRLDEVLQLLELEALQRRLPSELSGGQRQRAALGRCLVRRPAVFLLDEPLASLDPALAARLRSALRETLQGWGATVLWVTHDPAEARTVADRVITMTEGRIVGDSPNPGVRGQEVRGQGSGQTGNEPRITGTDP